MLMLGGCGIEQKATDIIAFFQLWCLDNGYLDDNGWPKIDQMYQDYKLAMAAKDAVEGLLNSYTAIMGK
jgi:hypothetical protein